MVKYLLVNAYVFLSFLSIAQTENKDVVITASGSGTSQELAKQIALRNAIEQAFGAFISSKTEIFNDEIVADQMSSVSSGNVKSYEVLNESQLPNGTWASTLRVIVSVDKLTSFVEAKGITVEIKGGLFALNIKQQLLNEQGEINAITEMFGVLHEVMQTAFDYTIQSGDPKSLDAESENWEIPLTVTAIANKNMDFCANYCIKTLAALSLSYEEVTSYKSLNKVVFPLNINYDGPARTIYLRKQNSIDLMTTFGSNWGFFTRLFKVQSGMDESNGKGESKFIHYFYNKTLSVTDYVKTSLITFNFLTSGQQAATFSWKDKWTLSQIEQMTGYKVKPRGVVSEFKHGGFVFYTYNSSYKVGLKMDPENKSVVLESFKGLPAEKAGIIAGDKIISINEFQVNDEDDIKNLVNKSEKENKLCEFKIERAGNILTMDVIPTFQPAGGLVVAITDFLEKKNWNPAKTACDELILNGYSDWYLPSKDELKYLYVNFRGLLKEEDYWSSTEYSNGLAWFFMFDVGYASYGSDFGSNVRAVRAF